MKSGPDCKAVQIKDIHILKPHPFMDPEIKWEHNW